MNGADSNFCMAFNNAMEDNRRSTSTPEATRAIVGRGSEGRSPFEDSGVGSHNASFMDDKRMSVPNGNPYDFGKIQLVKLVPVTSAGGSPTGSPPTAYYQAPPPPPPPHPFQFCPMPMPSYPMPYPQFAPQFAPSPFYFSAPVPPPAPHSPYGSQYIYGIAPAPPHPEHLQRQQQQQQQRRVPKKEVVTMRERNDGGASSSEGSEAGGKSFGKLCVFCRKNGEKKEIYESHDLHDEASGVVTCPVLRRYSCPTCGARGDNAHTIKYCPKVRKSAIDAARQKLAEQENRSVSPSVPAAATTPPPPPHSSASSSAASSEQ